MDNMPVDRIQTCCEFCARYYIGCCLCKSFSHSKSPCHSKKVVYTDGACSNNGRDDSAISAIGGIIGASGSGYSWSVRIDDIMDYGQRRTSQRAEMLAAMEGLRRLVLQQAGLDIGNGTAHQHLSESFKEVDNQYYVVATDSEYVVKGVTQWYPKWKQNNWRTAGGTRPVNLDLFHEFIQYIEDLERKGSTVKFWHIPRRFNQEADALATAATRD